MSQNFTEYYKTARLFISIINLILGPSKQIATKAMMGLLAIENTKVFN